MSRSVENEKSGIFRERRRLLLVGVVSIVACGCLLWCWPFDNAVPARELLLDETTFLQRAVADDIFTTADRHGAREHVGRSISIGAGGVTGITQEIYRYRTKWSATREYERQLRVFFPQGKWDTPWITPSELDYRSAVADQLFIACGKHGSIPQCRVLVRYSTYLVMFAFSGDATRPDELAHVLAAMDAIIETKLSNGK